MKREIILVIALLLIFNIASTSKSGTVFMSSVSGVNFLNDICALDANTVIATGSEGTILKTSNGGMNWMIISLNPSFDLRGIRFLNKNTGWMRSNFVGSLLKTTNSGNSWISYSQNIGPYFFINENTGWTSYSNAGTQLIISKSTDGGSNWNMQFLMSDNFYPNSVYFADENTGYVLSFNNGSYSKLLKTTNGGTNWNTQPFISGSMYSFNFLNSNTGWVVGSGGSILKTTNGCINWVAQNSGVNNYLQSIEFINENTGWISGVNVVLKTTNSGLSWVSQLDLPHTMFTSVSCNDSNNIWASGYYIDTSLGGIIYKSVNGGANWMNVYDNTVSVNNIAGSIPVGFSISQNFPNPFNPVTRISFSIPTSENSVLKIYDALGKELQVLVNERLNVGSYEVDFDGSNFASGVYFYKLEAGDFVETKRMILLK